MATKHQLTAQIPESRDLKDFVQNLQSLYDLELPSQEKMHVVIGGKKKSYQEAYEIFKTYGGTQMGLVWPGVLVLGINLFLPSSA